MRTSHPHRKDQMHPQDMRNMFIFFVVAALLYMTLDAFVLKPEAEAIKRAQQARLQMAQTQTAAAADENTPRPREEIIGQTGRIDFANEHIYGTISLQGARIDDLSLNDYYETLEKENHVTLFSPKGTAFPRYVEYGWVAAENENNVALPGADTLWQVEGNRKLGAGQPVKLVWDNGQGVRFENILSLDENYLITVTQKIVNYSGRKITLYPYNLVSQTGLSPDYRGLWVSHEGPIGYIGDELVELKYGRFRKEPSYTTEAYHGWAGITDMYWLAALLPPQGQDIKYRFNRSGPLPAKKEKDQGRFQADFTGPALAVESGSTGQFESHVFAGAKKVSLLKEYGKNLSLKNFDLAVDFGWFWFLSKPFYWALHFLYKHIGNMGIAIILLTVLIRSAVFPLTNLSYKSFAKMKKITPEVAKLRDTYGDNKAQLQQELMKLYQREGVSPMAGCLPILIQIPVFFALYKVLVVTIEMRHAPFFGWIHDLSAPDPTNIFNLFGLVPWDPPAFLHIGIWPCFMFVAFMLQKQLSPPPQDPIQRDMARYFPFLMTYMMANFASGLVIYWTFSAFIGVAQQAFIMRSLGVPIHMFSKTKEEKKLEKAIDEGPAVHPLIGMAEEKAEEALFGDDDRPVKTITSPKGRRKKKK